MGQRANSMEQRVRKLETGKGKKGNKRSPSKLHHSEKRKCFFGSNMNNLIKGKQARASLRVKP